MSILVRAQRSDKWSPTSHRGEYIQRYSANLLTPCLVINIVIPVKAMSGKNTASDAIPTIITVDPYLPPRTAKNVHTRWHPEIP